MLWMAVFGINKGKFSVININYVFPKDMSSPRVDTMLIKSALVVIINLFIIGCR
ncbi:hypothetical protein HMPREF0758_0698 [Serratia odorifera DSM 4582]|uniref:Uncharacterized protein n=1 Tax=Serratia odorifera DSM 4582 TaxID=667129 RepID=D4DXP8_SEROD|nr:hypothetical protein HMPREF0758_0698 [Serratia odorifera DSM 4582]